jgi:hypothetical protein
MRVLPYRSPQLMIVVAVISLLVLGVALYRPAARPDLAPVGAIDASRQIFTRAEGGVPPGAPTPAPALLTDNMQRVNGAYLQIIVADGLFDGEERARLNADLERALEYVSRRFGTGPSAPIETLIGREPSCGLHGIAYTDVRRVQVFTCPSLPRIRAVNIMAHEFVHQLAHDRYGNSHLATDLILLEGTATWGAGAYWLGDAADFRSFVRPWVAGGTALPLATSYVGRSINDMNTLYYQWGSFVEFLIEVYGRERFDALYVSGGNQVPGAANYVGVYGKGLDALEQEWRAWVLN